MYARERDRGKALLPLCVKSITRYCESHAGESASSYLCAHLQAAIFLHEELGGAQAMGGALIVAANLLA
jgi:hypothetical protein